MKTKKNMVSARKFDLRFWDESWTYIKTVVDIVREPVLILDKDFRVMAANECFYDTFKVDKKETEGKIVYELGNGQWNIAALKKLLETILPDHTFFKGFEVEHVFPEIGKKIMILNGRQIEVKDNKAGVGEIILLAMEDMTEMMMVAELLADHSNAIKAKMRVHVGKLEDIVKGIREI